MAYVHAELHLNGKGSKWNCYQQNPNPPLADLVRVDSQAFTITVLHVCSVSKTVD